ncbi:MAG: hypothetical protein M1820_007471 [Bogoriella megaspora]|nr:MAG: hypothetical protein M1820_007471 [Bogoriella megaspora]
MAATPAPTFVDSIDELRKMLDTFEDLPTSSVSIYVDLEGVDLSRHGTVSILQIHLAPQNHTYLVDIHVLQSQAFSITASNGITSLKTILESGTIRKAFFDVRNDSDALFSHFSIYLAGVVDIQLLELAARNYSRKYVSGLSKCVEKDAPMNATERSAWNTTKENGKKLFAPDQKGSYEVFNQRPMTTEIISYCAQDVWVLPKLLSRYQGKLSVAWKGKVEEATRKRIAQSQEPNFNGKGKHMAEGPAEWD